MAKRKLGRKRWTRKVKSADRPLKCTWSGCTKAFRFNSCLKRHKDSHLKEGQRPYLCQPCNTRFVQLAQLMRHQVRPKHYRGVALAELANQRGNENPEEEIRQAENGPMEVDINNGVHDNGEEEGHDEMETDNEVADDEEETEQEESDTEKEEESDTEKEESDTEKEEESASSDKEGLGSPDEEELIPREEMELNLPENEEETAPDEAEVNPSDDDELLDV